MDIFIEAGGISVAKKEKELAPDSQAMAADDTTESASSDPEKSEEASEATQPELTTEKEAESNEDQLSSDTQGTDDDASEVTFVSMSELKAEAEEPREESKPPVFRVETAFEPVDVSEPRTPRKESEIREEEAALRRENWIKNHLTLVLAAIGVVVVALMVVLIVLYYRGTNPVKRFSSAFTKDFGTSFSFDVKMIQNEKPVMSYQGSIASNRSAHTINALYTADYVDYKYIGAVMTEGRKSMRGSFYQDKWTAYDCTERVQDFFEFDRNFSTGGFNGGAFLRFTGLTSNYESREFERFVSSLMNRMMTDSPVATITSSKDGEGIHYTYQINLDELLAMVKKDGAPVFYRSTDYDNFLKMYEENKNVLEAAKCEFSYTIDTAGYLTALDLTVNVGEDAYGMRCRMSDFGNAEVEIPDGFVKTAALESEKK